MTVLFTSDLHLGHRLVAEKRGFDSVEEHDQAILDKWAATVRADDVVWVLGDLSISRPEKPCGLLAKLPGRKRLILGNHDSGHPMHRDAYRWTQVYTTAFEWVSQSARIKVHGREALLSHMPYTGDRGEARYVQWRLPDRGLPLLHGHTHSTARVTGPREIHVGLDAWNFTHVTDAQIADLLDGLPT